MCFVGYVQFACGHKRIIAQDCEIALAAQTPFFIRHQCPEYRHSSASPNAACGAGRFYCSETEDGPFLEHLHKSVATAQEDMTRVENQLANVTTAGQSLSEEWDRRGVPLVMRPHLQYYQNISSQHQQLKTEHDNLRRALEQSLAVIEQAREYYSRMNQHLRLGGVGAYPPFVPSANLFGKMPAEIAMARNAHIAANNGGPVYIPQRPTMTTQTTQLPPSPVASNLRIPQRHTSHNSHHPAGTSCRQSSRLSHPTSYALSSAQAPEEGAIAHDLTQNMQPPPSIKRRRGRTVKKATSRGRRSQLEEQDSMQDDGDSVRRSVRVRNKKINYAESIASPGASREPSPDKSDVSGFSPIKSDDSASPIRSARGTKVASSSQPSARKPQKQASSLSERLNDWARQSNLAKTTTPMQRRAMPGMKDLLNSSPADGTPMSNTTISSPAQAVSTGHHMAMPSFTHPTRPAYSLSDATGLDTLQQQQTQARPALTPSLMRPQHNSAKQPGQLSFFGLATLADPRTNAPPGTKDWLVHGQYVQDLSRPHFTPAPLSTAQAFNPLLQRGASGSGPHSFPADSSQTFGYRKDSVTSHVGTPTSHLLPSVALSNYANMRRSFSAGTMLTPPIVPSNTAETTEPRKRHRAPSNAAEQESKRLRLSLPGEESAAGSTYNTEWLLGQGMEQPLVPKNPYQDLASVEVNAELHAGNRVISTPAPRLAPTAVMSVPRQNFRSSNEGTETGTVDLPQLPTEQEAEEEEEEAEEEEASQQDGEFSDQIDWGTPYEEGAEGLV
ncbi:hypothetical protein B0A55_04194 [Friedmanniomyces simplex]|uniref:Uncharacterized protein n=1 Tax=Friedmanniomyces simplex TaxID=329884 RepID=A0A4U0XGY9_9PEZI|nr:hypothetical protein B0A55_04194 [Friedmanniomyces simplex]